MTQDLSSSDARIFTSRTVMLRPLTDADVTERYVSWFADETVTNFIQARNISADDAKAYLRHGWASREYFMYALCVRDSGLHIGNVKIGPIVWKHGVADLVTVIGDRDWWGKGLGAEAICLGSQAAFSVWNLRKLHGAILADNLGSVKAYTRGGWIEEGRLKGHYLLPDGSPSDAILVSCFNPVHFPDSTFPNAMRHHQLAG